MKNILSDSLFVRLLSSRLHGLVFTARRGGSGPIVQWERKKKCYHTESNVLFSSARALSPPLHTFVSDNFFFFFLILFNNTVLAYVKMLDFFELFNKRVILLDENKMMGIKRLLDGLKSIVMKILHRKYLLFSLICLVSSEIC